MTPPEWPALHPDALYGLAGEIVNESGPYTEADPAGVLLTFLAAAGAYFGNDAYVWAGDAYQPARVWPLLMGGTASGRKGTAWAVVKRFIESADDSFLTWHYESGLTSGPGLIERVRDADDSLAVKDPDPGVADKRLLVVESEFSGLLKRGGSKDNDLMDRVREAWDGGSMGTVARRANKLRATNPHIVIMGHVTPDELRMRLSDADVAGGTMNRFLPVLVRRSKKLPDGGGVPDGIVEILGEKLRKAKAATMSVHRVSRDAEADAWWSGELYDELTPDDLAEGTLARIVARAVPQVLRIAVTYALLDKECWIRREHLAAAMAVWRYVLASCKQVFQAAPAGPLSVVDQLARAVRMAGAEGLSKTEVSAVFGRNKKRPELDEITRQLVSRPGYGMVRRQSDAGGWASFLTYEFVRQDETVITEGSSESS
jgi:hypothetical protein